MKIPGNCHLQIKWLDNPEYKKWLDGGSSERKAKYSFCQKEFEISNMDEAITWRNEVSILDSIWVFS